MATLRRRSGGTYDPAIGACFRRHAPDILEAAAADAVWEAVLSAEPAGRPCLDSVALESAVHATAADAVLAAAGHRVRRARRPDPAGLSEREVEVLALLARGLPNREIADRLVTSRATVDHRICHIFDKAGGATRAAATIFALQQEIAYPQSGGSRPERRAMLKRTEPGDQQLDRERLGHDVVGTRVERVDDVIHRCLLGQEEDWGGHAVTA